MRNQRHTALLTTDSEKLVYLLCGDPRTDINNYWHPEKRNVLKREFSLRGLEF